MYVRFTSQLLNCFLKTVQKNQFFNSRRKIFPNFRPQKWKCFSTAIYCVCYRTSEGVLISQIISVFLAKSENLYNFRRITIHYFIHLSGESLQIFNLYWDIIFLFKKFFKGRPLVCTAMTHPYKGVVTKLRIIFLIL